MVTSVSVCVSMMMVLLNSTLPLERFPTSVESMLFFIVVFKLPIFIERREDPDRTTLKNRHDTIFRRMNHLLYMMFPPFHLPMHRLFILERRNDLPFLICVTFVFSSDLVVWVGGTRLVGRESKSDQEGVEGHSRGCRVFTVAWGHTGNVGSSSVGMDSMRCVVLVGGSFGEGEDSDWNGRSGCRCGMSVLLTIHSCRLTQGGYQG